MAITLKLSLRNHQLRLALKALVFAVFLTLARWFDFSIPATAIFLIVAAILYLRPIFQTPFYLPVFLILIIAGPLWLSYLPGYAAMIGVLVLSVLFYLLIGIKNLVLIERNAANLGLNLGLLYIVSLIFFLSHSAQPFYILLRLAGLFVASLFIAGGIFKGRRWSSVAVALLITEAAAVTVFLPIGFLASANLLFIVSWLMINFVYKYRQKFLTLREIIKDLVLSVALAALILIFSR